MGLYDTFIPRIRIPCPGCGTPSRSFQTKAFECIMETVEEGQSLSLAMLNDGLSTIEGKVKVYDFCDRCKKMVFCWVLIKNNVFVGVERID